MPVSMKPSLGVRLLLLLICSTEMLSPTPASAQPPRLVRVDHAGGQRGTTFSIVCVGDRLENIRQLLVDRPGLEFVSSRQSDAGDTVLTLRCPETTPLGEHPFRLVTAQGVTEMQTIHISPYPQSDESEPNNSVANAQVIPLGTSVHGLIDDGDVDVFAVALEAGQRLSAEVVGARRGGFLFDPWLGVSDATGKLLISSDDSTLLGQDPMLSFMAPESGTYFLHVREAAYGGDLDSTYIVHVGPHPRPVVAYPAGGQRGEELVVQLLGDASGPIAQRVTLPDSAESQWAWFVSDETGDTPSPLPMRLSAFPNVLEREPNDASQDRLLPASTLPVALNGILQTAGDRDVFRFRAERGQQFLVETFAARIGSPLDTLVSITGPDGAVVVQNDDGALHHDSSMRLRIPETGEYTLEISDHLNRGGAEYVYRVELQPVEAGLDLRIPILDNQRPQNRQAVQLAQGSRAVLLVTAQRREFEGAIELAVEDLPPGVTAETFPIEDGSHLSFVVFQSAEDTPLNSRLLALRGTAQDNPAAIRGGLRQSVGLTFGPPRSTIYHSAEVTRVPLAVTEPAPIRLQVVQPKAPLVQDGRLDLQVRIERRDDFEGDVKLRLPFLPPWFETPEEGVTIEAGQSEVVFPLTATSEAEPRGWRLVLEAEAVVTGESLYVCSNPFEVRVARPFVELELATTVAEQGSSARVRCDLNWLNSTAAQAEARLLGLPKDVEVPVVTVSPQVDTLEFSATIGPSAPTAVHNTLYVELTVAGEQEPAVHFLSRGGVLEVIPKGGKARESISRLEVLRRQKAARQQTPVPDRQESLK